MIDFSKGGISIKSGNVRRGFSWLELDKRESVMVGQDEILWADIQTAFDENGVDLDSPEMQTIIDNQRQSLIPEPKSKEQLKSQVDNEAKQIAMDKLIADKLIEIQPSIDAIKSKIDSGEISENAGQALRNEVNK